MRVVILADPLDFQKSGIHSYTQGLVNGLSEINSKHEFIIIRENVDPDLSLKQHGIPEKFELFGLDPIRKFIDIPKLIKTIKPDIVFEPAHFGPFNISEQTKRVTMIHDLTPINNPEWHRFGSSLLQRLFLKSILKKADLVLTNSNNTRSDVIKFYPLAIDKTKTIYLGIDAIFRPTKNRFLLDQLNIKQPYFLFVSTIEPRKDLSTLLKAFEIFKQEDATDHQLIITGQVGWKSNEIKSILINHPFSKDIIKTGYIEKELLPELYSHASSLVYPSLYEGFGIPVLEAMSCGTNVITAKNSSLTEVGGDLAYYFETKNVSELAKLLLELSIQNQESLRRRAVGLTYTKRFNWKNYANQFIKHLEVL